MIAILPEKTNYILKNTQCMYYILFGTEIFYLEESKKKF